MINLFRADFTEKAKVARSDNMAAYSQFAKMDIPKHVENIIEEEEEFGSALHSRTQVTPVSTRPRGSFTVAVSKATSRQGSGTRTLQAKGRKTREQSERQQQGKPSVISSATLASKATKGAAKPFSGRFPGSKIVHVNDTQACVRDQLIHSI